jgi:hypothetical protein
VGVFWTPNRLSSHLPIPSPSVLYNPIATTANETITSATVSSTLDVSPLLDGAEQPETDHEDDQRPRVVPSASP